VTADGRKPTDEVPQCGSYMSQSDFRLHFVVDKCGLGRTVGRWPDGKSEIVPGVAAGKS